MQPTKSITIVIVALMLTGMVGYFLQPTHEEIDVTTYDYKGDLTPSVLYSQIDDWVEYNPLGNVTGWEKSDNVIYPISENATAYLKEPVFVKYSDKTLSIRASGETSYQSYHKLSDYGFRTALDTNGTILTTQHDTGFYIRTGTVAVTTTKVADVLVWVKNESKLYDAELGENKEWIPKEKAKGYSLDELYTQDQPALAQGKYEAQSVYYQIAELSKPVYMDATKFMEIVNDKTASWTNEQVNGVVNILATKNTKIIVGSAGYEWTDLSISFVKNGINRTFAFNFTPGTPSFDSTVTDGLYTYTLDPGPGPAYYFPTPYDFTDHWGVVWTITPGMIMTNGLTNITYQEYTLTSEQGDRYTGYTERHYVSEKNITIPSDIPYEYVMCSLDFLNNSFTCRGVSSLDNTYSYTLANYDYPLTVVGDMPTSLSTLKFYADGSENAKVFISSTIVSVDPSGILWGNPTMPIQYFYPQQIDGNTRVLFNGFTKYGNSMTINGQTFEIVGGQLKYNYNEIVGYEKDSNGLDDLTRPIYEPRTDFYPVKGMAVDYILYDDNSGTSHTYVNLVFTEAMDKVIELGEAVTTTTNIQIGDMTVAVSDGYTIYATGTWYWQSGLYEIEHDVGDRLGIDLTGNFGLNMSMAALMMVFFIILGCAGVLRFTEMEFVALDWAIIFGSIALLIAVAIL